jgi:hypothetical protein
MSAERPAVVDESFRELVRDAVREVLREELAPLTRRNAGTLQGPEDGYLSVAKAAHLADVAPGTIRAWIRAGRLTAQRVGRVLRAVSSVAMPVSSPSRPPGSTGQYQAWSHPTQTRDILQAFIAAFRSLLADRTPVYLSPPMDTVSVPSCQEK